MLKIFFTLTPSFNPNDGGVQRTTYKLGKYFTEKGLDVNYYSLMHTGHIDAEFGKLFFSPEMGGCKEAANIMHLKATIRDVKPDIIINQMPYEAALRNALFELKDEAGFTLLGCLRNSLFSFKSNVKDIVRLHYPGRLFRFMNNKLVLSLINLNHKRKHGNELKEILDVHDKFILLTPPNRKELNYFIGNYKSSKVLAIPNSIPSVTSGLEHKEKIILHVGRLNIPQKRSDLLLPVWEQLYERLPDWKFIIVGDGPYRKKMEQQIQERKIPGIELVGFQKPEAFYNKASIFLMPSAYEGFPNVLIEAQSYGLVPVLVDSYLALSWIVNNKRDAFLCKPFDTIQISDCILRLAKNDSLLKEMMQASYNNARRFTIENVGKEWLSLFKEIGKLSHLENEVNTV
jgi:glycosyltransferase involved in cell wall biosynthesis